MSRSGAQASTLTLTGLIIAVSMTTIDQTIVALSAPTIESDLGLSHAAMQWAVNGYLIATAAAFLLGGRLADVFGHKRMVQLGIVGFGLTSLLCGLAPAGTYAGAWLSTARALQGVACAIMFPAAIGIVVQSLPREGRAKAMAAFFAITGAMTAVGPIAGGFLTQVDLAQRVPGQRPAGAGRLGDHRGVRAALGAAGRADRPARRSHRRRRVGGDRLRPPTGRILGLDEPVRDRQPDCRRAAGDHLRPVRAAHQRAAGHLPADPGALINPLTWPIMLAGAGVGFMLSTAATDAVNRANGASYGGVTAVNQTMRNFGAALGLAIFTTVVTGVLTRRR